MAALTPGEKAPGFELAATDGKKYGVTGLKPGEKAVVAFFKATCPTCMLAMPFIEKLFRHHQSDASVKIFAVAQEDPAGAQGFMKSYNLSLPVALDQSPYSVSSQYGLTNVPTVFVVDSDGKIEQTMIGFVKQEYVSLAQKLGAMVKKAAAPLFDGIVVPELKPG